MNALQNAFALADEIRASAAFAKSAAASGAVFAGGSYGFDHGYSKLTRAKEQYSHNKGWVYVAVKAIAQRIAGQSLYVGRVQSRPASRKLLLPRSLKSLGENIEPLSTHELLTALADPNPLMTAWPLMFTTVASLLLTGRSHWWLNDDDGKLSVYPLPTHWIRPADPMRGSWIVRPDGSVDEFTLDCDSVACFTLPDPSDPFGSISPLQSQAAAVSTDESIQQAQYRSFRDGIVPQLMLRVGAIPGMTPGTDQRPVLTPEQRIELVESFKQMYGGVTKRNEPLIVDALLESVERLSTTPAEMDYMQSGQQTKARILQAYGVNAAIVGELENSNRAAAAVAENNFCNNTCNPIVELLSQTLTQWLARRYGENLVCWVDPCSSDDRELSLAEWSKAASLGYVTCNEFRRHVLNIADIEGGDVRTDALGNPLETRSTLPAFSRNGHSH